ncbi:MAG: hypothetical protein WC722_14510, partial [Rhodospirillales bacterium]
KVPGKEQAGPACDRWDYKRISKHLDQEQKKRSIFVLPIAGLIETGNHISQAKKNRFSIAKNLADHLEQSVDAASPWAAFTEQSTLWEKDNLKRLAKEWPKLAVTGTSIGDATIKDVAEYYAKMGCHVEILTGDAGLKAYQPATPPSIPRRRR